MRATGFEPATVGFGVQRSTVGATPSWVTLLPQLRLSSLCFLINIISIYALREKDGSIILEVELVDSYRSFGFM